MANLLNLLGYQATWFALILSVQHGHPGLGTSVAVLFILATIASSRWRRTDLRLLLVALACGAVLDGLLVHTGLLHYDAATPSLPVSGAPAWILLLWAAFSTTLTRSLGSVRGRPWLAAVLGAVFGPLAYWSAAQGFAVVGWVPDHVALTTLVLSSGWMIALVSLAALAQRWQPRGAPAQIIGANAP